MSSEIKQQQHIKNSKTKISERNMKGLKRDISDEKELSDDMEVSIQVSLGDNMTVIKKHIIK